MSLLHPPVSDTDAVRDGSRRWFQLGSYVARSRRPTEILERASLTIHGLVVRDDINDELSLMTSMPSLP